MKRKHLSDIKYNTSNTPMMKKQNNTEVDYRELLKKTIKSTNHFSEVTFTEPELIALKTISSELNKEDNLEMALLMKNRGCVFSFDSDGRPVYINSLTGMPYISPRPKITEEEYNAL